MAEAESSSAPRGNPDAERQILGGAILGDGAARAAAAALVPEDFVCPIRRVIHGVVSRAIRAGEDVDASAVAAELQSQGFDLSPHEIADSIDAVTGLDIRTYTKLARHLQVIRRARELRSAMLAAAEELGDDTRPLEDRVRSALQATGSPREALLKAGVAVWGKAS